MKTYRFECIDTDDQTRTVVEFTTESDCWSGYDGPMYKFHDFLRGCGFCFNLNDEIGIMNDNGEFNSANIY
jgi:hypothetical protein